MKALTSLLTELADVFADGDHPLQAMKPNSEGGSGSGCFACVL